MEARDADAFRLAAVFNLKPAPRSEGQFVLGDLVALGQVGIKVVFPGEAGMLVDSAVQGQGRTYAHFDDASVEDRQRAGESEADGTRIGVGWIAKTRGASAEIFVLVRSWAWTSRPITASYLARSSGDIADSVATRHGKRKSIAEGRVGMRPGVSYGR